MEKQQLIKFVAKVMEDSGFTVYKNFRTIDKTVDIYAVLPSSVGEIGVVIACKNYEEEFEVGVDVLMEMEEVKESLDASKITIVTSSSFSPEAIDYSELKNIKLVDREGLIKLAKKYSNKPTSEEETVEEDDIGANRIPDEIEDDEVDSIQPDTVEQTPEDEEAVRSFLNKAYIPPETNTGSGRFFTGNRNNNNSSGSILNKQSSGPRRSDRSSLGSRNINLSNREMPAFLDKLRPILSNTIVLIIIVVVLSYLVQAALTAFTGISSGIAGVVELLIALALSYGLILLFDREGSQILVKGTIIFFISLILLMLLVIL